MLQLLRYGLALWSHFVQQDFHWYTCPQSWLWSYFSKLGSLLCITVRLSCFCFFWETEVIYVAITSSYWTSYKICCWRNDWAANFLLKNRRRPKNFFCITQIVRPKQVSVSTPKRVLSFRFCLREIWCFIKSIVRFIFYFHFKLTHLRAFFILIYERETCTCCTNESSFFCSKSFNWIWSRIISVAMHNLVISSNLPSTKTEMFYKLLLSSNLTDSSTLCMLRCHSYGLVIKLIFNSKCFSDGWSPPSAQSLLTKVTSSW